MNGELPNHKNLVQRVLSVNNEETFNSIVFELFDFQFKYNAVYQQYCMALNRDPENVKHLEDIPFLPISCFKTHNVVTGQQNPEVIFESSGTTGQMPSRHHVLSSSLYQQSFEACFERFFGPVKDYCIIGLLPSYLERSGSSLVYMVEHLIKQSGHEKSGFYLTNMDSLYRTLCELETQAQKTILFGVSFALVDFATLYPMPLKNTILIETGGMKGRRQELTRDELHQILREAFSLPVIHSEYGMTELLSQAYGQDGKYLCPPWMKVVIRDETDPFALMYDGKNASGGINIIDLANLYSCSFIATDDAGKIYPDGSFEVMGRLDYSDLRGCSLMVMED
jgi:hypothetical protein